MRERAGGSAARRKSSIALRRRVGIFGLALATAMVAGACITPQPGGGGPANLAPVAAASVAASAGEAPFTAQFSSEGSSDPDGQIVEYRWNFGDGSTATEPNPTKVYELPGRYDVSLEVVDDGGLVAAVSTLTVTAYVPGDPSALILFPNLSRSVSIGEDRIAVWSCQVTGEPRPAHDPAAIATWAQSAADAYYAGVSRGRYHPVFTAAGTFTTDDYTSCLPEARTRTGAPFTNVLVVDNTLVGGGLGGPGSVYSHGGGAAPAAPPAESGRGFTVYGNSFSEFPSPRVLVHEIGHSLHWPHSYLTPTNQYDNPLDLMSGHPGGYTCSVPGWIYKCEAHHTLAFNRWGSGWIDPGEVVVHSSGSRTVDLAAPLAAGPQLVVAPSVTSSRALVTIEARPKAGFDHLLDTGGVAVHVVDQRRAMCNVGATFDGCPSLWRRQGQATGAAGSYEHVVLPGQTRTIRGLTITVEAATASGYRVAVSGSATVPADALQPKPALRAAPEPRPGGGWSIDLPSNAPLVGRPGS